MKDRIKEAEVIFKRVAKSNHVDLPEGLLQNIEKNDSNESGQFWKIGKHCTVLTRTIIIIFNRYESLLFLFLFIFLTSFVTMQTLLLKLSLQLNLIVEDSFTMCVVVWKKCEIEANLIF